MNNLTMKRLTFLLFIFLIISNVNAQKWVKVWGDEFNTPGLPDTSKWSYEVGKIRNNELQYYTVKRSENARIQDTVLIIEARKEKYMGADYTSASLISKFKGDWQYGKMEFSAKVPGGKGTWPAIWMMPTYNEYGSWPKSGEIDIMEYVGMNPSNLYFTVHYEGTDGTGHQSSGGSTVISQPYNRFIKFTLEWSPSAIKWYANDKLCYTYNKSADDQRVWPFNKMFYLILNLAYGGAWGGQQGVDDTKLPHQFLIDYVRVYQFQESEGPFSLKVDKPVGGTVTVSPEQENYEDGTPVKLTAVPEEGYVFDKWLHVGAENPIQLKMNKDWNITPVFVKKNEIIQNGDFSNRLSSWSSWSEASVAPVFSLSADDGIFVCDISKSGTANWHIVEQQLNIPLVQGATYNVSFDAWAENPNSMLLILSRNSGTYADYYSTTKSVTSTPQHFTWSVKMTYASDNNCRFGFGLGLFSGKVYIDNVSVEKVLATDVESLTKPDEVAFAVYPNPATLMLRIISHCDMKSPVSVSLFNLQGQLVTVLKSDADFESGNSIEIDLRKFSVPKGLYLIRFVSGEKQFIQKLVINQ